MCGKGASVKMRHVFLQQLFVFRALSVNIRSQSSDAGLSSVYCQILLLADNFNKYQPKKSEILKKDLKGGKKKWQMVKAPMMGATFKSSASGWRNLIRTGNVLDVLYQNIKEICRHE